jgi:hypothetical protein
MQSAKETWAQLSLHLHPDQLPYNIQQSFCALLYGYYLFAKQININGNDQKLMCPIPSLFPWAFQLNIPKQCW